MKCWNVSDCRVQKRASASLSLRLPRGRPPAVGITSDFFNMTPPSAEAVTPTQELPKPIITETVEGSILVPAKENDVPIERTIPVDVEPVTEPVTEIPEVDKIVPASRPDYNPNPHS